jgi:hypothetical protein
MAATAMKSAILLPLALLASCSLPVRESGAVQVYATASPALTTGASFRWSGATEPGEELRQRSLYRMTVAALEAQGLREAGEGEDADLELQLQASMSEETVVVPAHLDRRYSYSRGRLYPVTVCDSSGRIGTTWRYGPGTWLEIPILVPEREVTAWRLGLRIDLAAADGDPLWQGEVDTLSASADLQGRARAWIPELLRGFPTAKGLPAERTVEILPPEGD